MKKKIFIILVCLFAIAGCLYGMKLQYEENTTETIITTNVIEEVEEETTDVIVSKEAEEIVRDTIQATEEGEDLSTTEEIESTEEEEQLLEEENLEQDALVEQENISYEGDSTGNGLSLLGTYQGLTYYSQADSRWASVMYSSIGDSSQTMKSSACGPTSAAMVVSSSKGTILPTAMAELAVNNGYRTASSGTAWSYFSFVADYFDFDEFYTTYSFDTAMNYLKTDNDNDGNSDYYIIVSCGSGLFTTGGHYIVLVADNDDTITVYDPYLYTNKFNTASRKSAGVVVSGNSVYVTEEAFKTYANYKCFWVFSNDEGEGNTNTTVTSNDTANTVNYTRYVSTQSTNLNVRSGAGTNYSIVRKLAKGTTVTVYEVDGNWSRIGDNEWVSTSYLSSTPVTTTASATVSSSSYTTGKYKVTANLLNVRSGAGTSYSKKTYTQLTANARSQNKSLGNYYANGYKKGVVCTVTQVKGNWGKTASGWICLDYCKKQ